jgi:5-formyltetrahydrofolate cyclo-ligase
MTKAQVRSQMLAARRAMSASQRAEAATAIAHHVLALPLLTRARRVACYVSMPSEPGTGPLIDGLQARGIEVLVPVSLPDGTLDWVLLGTSPTFTVTDLGIREPDGPRLGPDAVASCGLLIVPALAMDHQGMRLGRGAGYYDRALADATAPTCALVFAHEVLPRVPSEPHDVPVAMTATPVALIRHQ